MANPTSNFGWQMPTNTDLVKDLPADFEVFGQAVDTSLMDLKGGTTGQVLSKASNTDMDFTWVTSDDANAIQNTIVDAKGDLISASAADVPARLAVGNNGETLVADSSATTGLRWQGNFAAGKNKIINGDFNVWQRGTTFSNPSSNSYTADRFLISHDGTGATRTISRQTFTPGAAPVAGYEGNYFYRYAFTAVGTSNSYCTVAVQRIEDVSTFAGQTITVSFWAKNDTSKSFNVYYGQNFGSGGSAAVSGNSAITIGTSWARYSVTFNIPSISGKTVGSSSYLELYIADVAGTRSAFTLDLWGFQAEIGSVATAFQTATGTLAGELAACERYYYRIANGQAYSVFGAGAASSTTVIRVAIPTHVTMRVTPTSIDYANLTIWDYSGTALTPSAYALANLANNPDNPQIDVTVSGATQHRPYYLVANNNTNAYFGLSAEL